MSHSSSREILMLNHCIIPVRSSVQDRAALNCVYWLSKSTLLLTVLWFVPSGRSSRGCLSRALRRRSGASTVRETNAENKVQLWVKLILVQLWDADAYFTWIQEMLYEDTHTEAVFSYVVCRSKSDADLSLPLLGLMWWVILVLLQSEEFLTLLVQYLKVSVLI